MWHSVAAALVTALKFYVVDMGSVSTLILLEITCVSMSIIYKLGWSVRCGLGNVRQSVRQYV